MRTTITSIKCESFEGTFTGMITINLATEVDGNIITEDGVFATGKTNKIRVHVSYFMAILRNLPKHGTAVSAWLDSLKVAALPMRQAAWAMAVKGQEIDIEPELKDADEDHSDQWYSHTITSIGISDAVLDAAYEAMVLTLNPTISDARLEKKVAQLRQMAEIEE